MSRLSLALIGTGPVALAIGRRHVSAGGCVVAVVSRDAERGRWAASAVGADAGGDRLTAVFAADAVVVAVSDVAIPSVGERLAAVAGSRSPVVLHTSGALAGAYLGAPSLSCGSLHPLQSLPRPAAADADPAPALAARLEGAHWFHEGAGAEVAKRLVTAWGGAFHSLAPGGKALYHAGAAMLSNHAVALFSAATELFGEAGVSADAARAPLAQLLLGTASNLAAVGSPEALTGPIARGEATTVARHLEALRAAAPHLLPSYLEMARLTLSLAEARGLDPGRATALRALLTSQG